MKNTRSSTGSIIARTAIPTGSNVIFKESAFFRNNSALPSPAEVRAASTWNQKGRPDPVKYPDLKLLVKYGTEVAIEEGQCLWALRRFAPVVPVPEIYGWCQHAGETFLYMHLAPGITLQQAWPEMEVEDRFTICRHLYYILEHLRQLRQDPNDCFIGKIAMIAYFQLTFYIRRC